jgi:hypothetical protein
MWQFMRPMLSPALVALNRDAFVIDEPADTTVDLEAHRVWYSGSRSRSLRVVPERDRATGSGDRRFGRNVQL